jgi:predicted lipid carrier protein YhbT
MHHAPNHHVPNHSERSNTPQLPPFLAAPLGLVPNLLHTRLLVSLLNHLFRQQLAEGDLDFLESRTAVIQLLDAGVALRFTKGRQQLVAHSGEGPVDLTISGNLYDFLQLSMGREDPDTLFFQRRIRLQGDVELGLETKNLLYGLELEALSIPAPLRSALQRALTHYRS